MAGQGPTTRWYWSPISGAGRPSTGCSPRWTSSATWAVTIRSSSWRPRWRPSSSGIKRPRRLHPLARSGRSLAEAVQLERAALEPVRQRAEYIVDTSALSTAQLRGEMLRMFGDQGDAPAMSVTVISFGFKYGIPLEADLVFDVRFLPQPLLYHRAPAPHGAGGLRPGFHLRLPADQGLREAAGADGGLPASPLCHRGEERPRDRRGLHRRPPPVGGHRPVPGQLHPAEGVQRGGGPPGHDPGVGTSPGGDRYRGKESVDHALQPLGRPVEAGAQDRRHRRRYRPVHHAPGPETVYPRSHRHRHCGR